MTGPQVLNAKEVGSRSTSFRSYIGRPSKWGNRFVIGRDGTRWDVIEKYGVWLAQQPELLLCLPELTGKDLVCWCSPLACHGHILLELANSDICWLDNLQHISGQNGFLRSTS